MCDHYYFLIISEQYICNIMVSSVDRWNRPCDENPYLWYRLYQGHQKDCIHPYKLFSYVLNLWAAQQSWKDLLGVGRPLIGQEVVLDGVYSLISYPEQNLLQSRLALQHVTMVIYPGKRLTSIVRWKIQNEAWSYLDREKFSFAGLWNQTECEECHNKNKCWSKEDKTINESQNWGLVWH